jgi:ribonuclease P protein component
VTAAKRGRFALHGERRLRKRNEFLHVQNDGYRVSLPSFIVLLCARGDDRPARFGITVTRKFGNAVVRNRIKRLIREAFRLTREGVPAGIDLVIIPKRTASPAGLAAVLEEWRTAAPLLGRQAARLRAKLAKRPEPTHTAAPQSKKP